MKILGRNAAILVAQIVGLATLICLASRLPRKTTVTAIVVAPKRPIYGRNMPQRLRSRGGRWNGALLPDGVRRANEADGVILFEVLGQGGGDLLAAATAEPVTRDMERIDKILEQGAEGIRRVLPADDSRGYF